MTTRFPAGLVSIVLAAVVMSAAPARAAEYSRYHIQAQVDPHAKTVTATEAVTFVNSSRQATDVLYFRIYPNRLYTATEQKFILRYASYFKIDPYPEGFPKDAVHIRQVTQGQAPLTYAIEGDDKTILKVQLPASLKPGESVEVAINFDVKVPHAYGRFGWNGSIMALSRFYPVLSVLNDKGWNNAPFYVFHRPFFTDASIYSVDLTVPADQVVIHSGELKSEESQGALKTLHIESGQPIREFTMTLSPDYRVVKGEFKGVTLNAFYLDGQEAAAQKALKDVQDLFAYYTDHFGPYPYATFSLAPVYLGHGGEQMSNMVLLDTRDFTMPAFLDRYLDFLVSHETGHQWFYNIVGYDEFDQMWLEEGWNSYFGLQYLEHKYGHGAAVLDFSHYPPALQKMAELLLPDLTFHRARDVRYRVMARQGLDQSIINPLSSFSEPSSIFALTYGKGSDVIDMLRNLVGDDVFFHAMTRIFQEYKFQTMDVDQLRQVFEQDSGKDLKWFFDEWLTTAKTLDVAVAGVKPNAVVLRNRGGISMPVDVGVDFADGTHEQLAWDAKTTSAELPTSHHGLIRKVVVDPQEKVMDIDRTNNTWPREVRFYPVLLYHGLYDIPALMPDDHYNVVFGPEVANGGLGVKASIQKPYDQILYGGSDYNFSDQLLKTRVGYELENVLHSQTTLGFEMMNTTDYDSHEDDLVSGKLFLRRELWPAPYSTTVINDHITLYVLRNLGLSNTKLYGGSEYADDISYAKRNESITGVTLHLSRARPLPDPREGFTVDTMVENSGHFLNATQAFNRASLTTSFYQKVTQQSKLAFRMMGAWGWPDDRNLFELGGIDGLRGFDRKTLRGSHGALGSAEYRFPLINNIDARFLDNTIGLEKISGVAFFDAGQNWYDAFKDSKLHKDAGFGLRYHVNLASSMEQMIVRMDVAWPISDNDRDPHFWFGVNQAF